MPLMCQESTLPARGMAPTTRLTDLLILRRPLNPIDYEHFDRPFSRLQLEAELFLDCGKNRGAQVDGNGGWVWAG
jgi:hypothetical protein